MATYQTALYQAVFVNKQFGWDYGAVVFESKKHDNPTDAIMEFSQKDHIIEHWIGTIRVINNDEITEEEMFDSSVIKED